MKTIDFVAGLTIEQAISQAKQESIKLKEPVLADINDIVLVIDKNTDIAKTLAEYRSKLNFKYEISKMKYHREKQQ